MLPSLRQIFSSRGALMVKPKLSFYFLLHKSLIINLDLLFKVQSWYRFLMSCLLHRKKITQSLEGNGVLGLTLFIFLEPVKMHFIDESNGHNPSTWNTYRSSTYANTSNSNFCRRYCYIVCAQPMGLSDNEELGHNQWAYDYEIFHILHPLT